MSHTVNKNRNNLSDWIKNTKLSNEDIFNSKKKYFICENHFESKYFAGYRLVKTAYPSLFPQPYREQSEECELIQNSKTSSRHESDLVENFSGTKDTNCTLTESTSLSFDYSKAVKNYDVNKSLTDLTLENIEKLPDPYFDKVCEDDNKVFIETEQKRIRTIIMHQKQNIRQRYKISLLNSKYFRVARNKTILKKRLKRLMRQNKKLKLCLKMDKTRSLNDLINKQNVPMSSKVLSSPKYRV